MQYTSAHNSLNPYMAGFLIPTYPRSQLLASVALSNGNTLPLVSLIIPFYNEHASIFWRSANALQAIDYPRERLEIIWIIEEADQAAKATASQVLEAIKELPPAAINNRWLVLNVPDMSPKAKAINRAIAQASGDIVGFLDADVVPDPLQVKMAVAALQSGRWAAVDAPEFPETGEGWFFKVICAEQIAWHASMLWINRLIGCHLLASSSLYLPRQIMQEVGLYNEEAGIEEGVEWTLRFASLGLKSGMLKAASRGAAIRGAWAGIRQRGRWARGQFEVCVKLRRFLFNPRSGTLMWATLVSDLARLSIPMLLVLSTFYRPFFLLLAVLLILEGCRLFLAARATQNFAVPDSITGWLLLPFWEISVSLGYWLGVFEFVLRQRSWYKARS